MKALAVLLLVSTASAAKPKWHELEAYSFDRYLADFGKASRYAPVEADKRRAIFESRLKDIKAHNAKNLSWRKGVNHLTDLTDAERASMRGYNKALGFYHRNVMNASTITLHQKSFDQLPTSLDWRTRGVLSAVKDQGQCGSCWAFAATETLEARIAVKEGRVLSLAPQHIASCAPNPQQCGGTGGCDGSIVQLAYKYLQSCGGQAESFTYGYASYWGQNEQCRFKNARGAGGTPPIAEVTAYHSITSNDMLSTLNAVQDGPIAVSVDASAWSDYESGIFTGCSTANVDIDHAVQLVGYGEENGQKFWIVRNSWNPTWGENGYIRLARSDQMACYLDKSPGDGDGCKGGPPQIRVCGDCGILYDNAYPEGKSL